MAVKVDETYGEADITILEGLEPVRKRPGMYIGSTGPTGLHHLVWEVVDNSVDEAMAGYVRPASTYVILADGGVRVTDDGAGIPIGPDPKDQKGSPPPRSSSPCSTPAASSASGGYKVSGGLHGVGVSVVNALSTRLLLEIDRDGDHQDAEFEDGGKPSAEREVTGQAPKDRAREPGRDDRHLLARRHRLRGDRVPGPDHDRAAADDGLLEQGPRDPLRRRAAGPGDEVADLQLQGGIVDFVRHLNASKEALFRKVSLVRADRGDAWRWRSRCSGTPASTSSIHSFANGISTIDGGMHEEGFNKSLTNVVNRYARARNLLKEKEENLKGEDIREGLTAIISVRLQRPPVRGPDQGQAREPEHPLAHRAHHQPEAHRVARGEPPRGEPDRPEVDAGRPGPPRRPGRA